MRQQPMNVNPAQAQAYIVNPLTGRKLEVANVWNRTGRASGSVACAPRRTDRAAINPTATLRRCDDRGREYSWPSP